MRNSLMPEEDRESKEQSDDPNVEGKSLVDSVTGQDTGVDATELISDQNVRDLLKRIKNTEN